MKDELIYKKIGAYFWLVTGSIIMLGSIDQILEGLASEKFVITVHKYHIRFTDTEALIMMLSMFLFGAIAFYLGWVKLKKCNTHA